MAPRGGPLVIVPAPGGRVFGYTRVSSDGQADNTSLAVQAERIAAFALTGAALSAGLIAFLDRFESSPSVGEAGADDD